MKQINAVTVNTSDAILALCNYVARRGPLTFRPIDPYTGKYVDYIYVNIPKNADDYDFNNLRWLKDHPRKGVVLNYQRMYLRSPMVVSK